MVLVVEPCELGLVLIDRQTGWALLRAKGVSSTTSSRMRLQACTSFPMF